MSGFGIGWQSPTLSLSIACRECKRNFLQIEHSTNITSSKCIVRGRVTTCFLHLYTLFFFLQRNPSREKEYFFKDLSMSVWWVSTCIESQFLIIGWAADNADACSITPFDIRLVLSISLFFFGVFLANRHETRIIKIKTIPIRKRIHPVRKRDLMRSMLSKNREIILSVINWMSYYLIHWHWFHIVHHSNVCHI